MSDARSQPDFSEDMPWYDYMLLASLGGAGISAVGWTLFSPFCVVVGGLLR